MLGQMYPSFPNLFRQQFCKSKKVGGEKKKKVELALPASDKLVGRCSDSVPEGIGSLVFWNYRVCCFESTFKLS